VHSELKDIARRSRGVKNLFTWYNIGITWLIRNALAVNIPDAAKAIQNSQLTRSTGNSSMRNAKKHVIPHKPRVTQSECKYSWNRSYTWGFWPQNSKPKTSPPPRGPMIPPGNFGKLAPYIQIKFYYFKSYLSTQSASSNKSMQK
jgi:hypothetical protein